MFDQIIIYASWWIYKKIIPGTTGYFKEIFLSHDLSFIYVLIYSKYVFLN